MKHVKFQLVSLAIFIIVFVIQTNADKFKESSKEGKVIQRVARKSEEIDFKRIKRCSKESHSRERKHQYPCGNKFYHYYLDDEPAEYGLYAGDYEKGKAAYVGIVDAIELTLSARVQLSPPGVYHDAGKQMHFVNDSSKIWYLYNNPHHKYEWVDSQHAEKVPFGIDFGSDTYGDVLYIGRIKRSDKTMSLGTVSPTTGQMYYLNEKYTPTMITKGYQVLTCKSCKPDKHIPTPNPRPTLTAPLVETGCIHNWVEYKGDDAPSKNGISAGSFDCGNTAYVGKGSPRNFMYAGRIQTVLNAGLYYMVDGKQTFMKNGSYYLADNPNYSYYWVEYKGNYPRYNDKNIYPENCVSLKSTFNSFYVPIARAKINGHMQIGSLIDREAYFPGDDLTVVRYTNYEILVCDPWPKYQCGQEWKKFAGRNRLSTDGFSVGSYKDDIISYIGRGTCKQINGCDYELGRIQATPLNASGVYYLDDLTATEKFDKVTAEYLVKNPKYFYEWVASRSGVRVENALEIHKEGHRPFYIGVTQINDNVFVGKVRPGEGLFFVDINGKQKTTSSYNVLTCTSSDAANDVYKEKSDESWFGSFVCPVRKNWDFKQWRCVCRDEFKGIFTSSNAKWNEDTCSYSV